MPASSRCDVCGLKTTNRDKRCGFCRVETPDQHDQADVEALMERYDDLAGRAS